MKTSPPVQPGGFLSPIDQPKAKATKPEQSRTTPATVTARKLFEANSSRMRHHRSLSPARKERRSHCTVKEFSFWRPNSTWVDVLMQQLFTPAPFHDDEWCEQYQWVSRHFHDQQRWHLANNAITASIPYWRKSRLSLRSSRPPVENSSPSRPSCVNRSAGRSRPGPRMRGPMTPA